MRSSTGGRFNENTTQEPGNTTQELDPEELYLKTAVVASSKNIGGETLGSDA